MTSVSVSFNAPLVAVRGGRVLKWKGKVASVAPFVVGVVPALTLGALMNATTGGAAQAAACNVNSNGTISVNNSSNSDGCEVSSVGPVIGNTSVWNLGFQIYSQGKDRTLELLNDIETTVKGSSGITSYGSGSSFSHFNAAGRTITLTMETLDANAGKAEGDAIAKVGVNASHGSKVEIGTLDLTMLDLPKGTGLRDTYEHYGVLAGSSASADEPVVTSGKFSHAIFDNLNIRMSSNRSSWLSSYPLLAGIRAIQGAGKSNPGQGSSGNVEVREKLVLNIAAASNDAIGIYVSGGESQVHLKDSEITIASTSSRANAIRLGKTAAVGTGSGQLYSTGEMLLDTTAATRDAAIDIIWQGAILDAGGDAARTEIRAGGAAISVSGQFDQATDRTVTTFNNLVASTTSSNADLVDVGSKQNDYRLTIRGAESNLTASSGGYLIDIASASNVTMDFAEGYLQGLTRTQASSTLDLTVRDGAYWQLAAAGADQTSSFSTLTLRDSNLVAHRLDHAPASFVLKGDVVNSGSEIDLSNDLAGDVLTIDGNYTTGGGLWLLDATLTGTGPVSEGGSTVSDSVVITGDTIDVGSDRVWVNNLALTDPTGTESFRLIEVRGQSAGEFLLQQRVVKGAYEYLLNKHDDGSWYLESVAAGTGGGGSSVPVIRPEVGAHAANALGAAAMFDHGWRDRIGAIRSIDAERRLWLRMEGTFGAMASEAGQLDTDFSRKIFHFGVDLARWNTDGRGEFALGAMAAHGEQKSDILSRVTGNTAWGEVEGKAVGLYASWVENGFERKGWYVDSWLMFGRHEAEVTGIGLATETHDIDTTTLSFETGYAFDVWNNGDRRFWLEPQGQLIWSMLAGESFTDASGTEVSLGGHGLTSRLGLRAALDGMTEGARARSTGFVQLDWLHAWERPEIVLDGRKAGQGARDALRIGVGYEHGWTEDTRTSLRIDYTNARDGADNLRLSLGFRHRF